MPSPREELREHLRVSRRPAGSRTGTFVRSGLVPWLALLAALGSALASPSGAVDPGTPVVLDALADPLGTGGFGTLFRVDRQGDPAANDLILAGLPEGYLAGSLVAEPGGDLVVSDAEADPSGLGTVPGGGDGPGALFRVAAATGQASLLSDGSNFSPGLPGGLSTIFVEPGGLARAGDGFLLLADLDADPSGFGADPAGLAGHGALFRVDPSNGLVSLLSDGSRMPGGPPGGEESAFVDPVGVAVDPATGDVFLLDAGADPLGLGHRGAVFRVAPDGEVRTLATPPEFDRPADLGVLPDGRVVVAGNDAVSGAGTLWVLDPGRPDPQAPAPVLARDPLFQVPRGLDVAPNGWVFVADEFADPLGLNRLGALFRIDPEDGASTTVSSGAQWLAPGDVALPLPVDPPPDPQGAQPATLPEGEVTEVTVTGAGFRPGALVEAGEGVQVLDVTVQDAASMLVVMEVPLGTAPGARDLLVTNPDLQEGVLPEALAVEARPGPGLDGVDPVEGPRGGLLTVELQGVNFDPQASLEFGAGIQVLEARWTDSTRLQADLAIEANASLGPRDVRVVNPDTLSDTLTDGFNVVLPPPPMISSVEPTLLSPGEATVLSVGGRGFRSGAEVTVGVGIRVLEVEVLGPDRLQVLLWTEAGAVPGPRDLSVADAETGSDTEPGAVEVEALPRLSLAGLRVEDRDPASGNGSRFADPGETVDLVPTLVNRGNVPASQPSLVLRVEPPVPGVRVVDSFARLEDIPVGQGRRGNVPPWHRLEVGTGVACGALIPLLFEVTPSGGLPQFLPAVLPVGSPRTYEVDLALEGGPGDRLGEALAGLGDVDGDGFPDWAVGAPGHDGVAGIDAGRVLVFSGGEGDLLAVWEGTEPDEGFGFRVAGPGDLDGDGRGELVVASPAAAGGRGRVEAWSVAEERLLWFREGEGVDALGRGLGAVGDADGDTVPDIAVGAPDADGASGDEGEVLLLSGRDGSLLAWSQGALGGDRFGWSVEGVGDLDGDGLGDWLAGLPGRDGDTGGAEAQGLGPAGLRALWSRSGPGPASGYGSGTASLGDVTGDGRNDLLVAAPAAGSEEGWVEVLDHRGVAWWQRSGGAGESLGRAASAAPDVDGDGFDDVWIGVPGAHGGEGDIQLRSGVDGRLLGLWSGQPGEERGARLERPGDLDGDGWADLLAGSPGADATPIGDEGRVERWVSRVDCRAFEPCQDDGREPNDTRAEAVDVPFQELQEELMACREDPDWFRPERSAGGDLAVRVAWDPADGDLGVFLWDASGLLLDAAPAGPAGPPGFAEVGGGLSGFDTLFLEIRSVGDLPVPYRFETLDPAACRPVQEVEDLRLTREGGEILLSWRGVTDVCHAGYRVYRAATAVPASPPGSFPNDPLFLSVPDQDGSTTDAAARVPGLHPLDHLLVVTVGGLGGPEDVGPAGHYGR